MISLLDQTEKMLILEVDPPLELEEEIPPAREPYAPA